MKSTRALTFLLMCVFIVVNSLTAQDDGTAFHAEAWQRQNNVVPPSPQAASLGSYGNLPVNYFTGAPNINIPLYTIGGKYISAPLSLSYDISGIKVANLPSWVGLGWTLNGGGVITRTVRGAPDGRDNYFDVFETWGRYPEWDSLLAQTSCNAILENDFRYRIAAGDIELQPDVYYFNFPGGSGSFVIGRDKALVQRDRSDLTITPVFDSQDQVTSFTVTDPYGVSYQFTAVETTRLYVRGQDEILDPKLIPEYPVFEYEYPSSWHLTSITSADNSESLSFTYQGVTEDYYSLPINIETDDSKTYSKKIGEDLTHQYASMSFGAGTPDETKPRIYDRRFLQSITLNIGGQPVEKAVFYINQIAEDTLDPKSSGVQLQAFEIERAWQGSLEKVLRFRFVYDNSTGRMTLKEVEEMGYNELGVLESPKPPYIFDYDTQQLPPVLSNAIDYWGYFNNANGNTSLIPRVNIGGEWLNTSGATRKAISNEAGALSAIHYPTGGSTEFEYEPHQVAGITGDDVTNLGSYIGGLRLRSIKDYASAGQLALQRTFKYRTADTLQTSSGVLLEDVEYAKSTWYEKIKPPGVSCLPGEELCDEYEVSSITVFAYNASSLGAIQGSHIGYSRVEEFHGTEGENIGKVVYHFDATKSAANIWNTKAGTLVRKEVYSQQEVMVKPFREDVQTLELSRLERLEEYDYSFPGHGTQSFYYLVESDYDQNNLTQLCGYDGDCSSCCDTYQWRHPAGSYSPACDTAVIFETKYDRYSRHFQTTWTRLNWQRETDFFYQDPGEGVIDLDVGLNLPTSDQGWIDLLYGTSKTVVKTTNFEYNDADLTLPTATAFNNSDGTIHRTETIYSDNTISSIRAAPEKITVKVGGQTVGGIHNTLDGFGRPLSINEIIKNDGEVLKATIHGYQDGRPTGATFMGQLPEDYTWINGLLTKREKGLWTWEYDYNNRRLMTSMTDIDAQQVFYAYDPIMRLDSIIARDNNIITTYEYVYGGPNQIIELIDYSDAPDQNFTREFDGLGRPTAVYHNGVAKKEYFYDTFWRMFRETYLPGNYTTYSFDNSPLRRVTAQEFPDNSRTETEYYAENNHYQVTNFDEKGNPTHTFTEIVGRTAWIENALEGVTQFDYDGRGNPLTVTPPSGPLYEYDYDDRFRMISRIIPGKGEEIFAYYDANDLLQFSLDANGNRVDYIYDEYLRDSLVLLNTGITSGTGSPGSPIITTVYGETDGPKSNYGKVMSVESDVLGTASWPVTLTEFTYDAYGRVATQKETYPLENGPANSGTDDFEFTYNQADWLLLEKRIHNAHESLTVTTSHFYDQFGRETGYFTGADQPSAMGVAMEYNIRDEMIWKKLGPTGYGYLDKINYFYTPRGWLERMNDIILNESDRAFCEESDTTDVTYQIEDKVTLSELLDLLCEGADVAVNDLDPCRDADCKEEAYNYDIRIESRVRMADSATVWNLYLDSLTAFHPEGSATATVLPLSYPYEFEISSHIDLGLILTRDDSDSLASHLSDWLLTNGYHFDNIEVDFFLEADSFPVLSELRIVIDTLNLRLDQLWFHVSDGKQANRDLSEQNPVLIDCVDIPDGELPPGSGSDVSDPGDLDFPAVLYETIREDGTRDWNFEKEFGKDTVTLIRERRIHLNSAQDSLLLRRTDGTSDKVDLLTFLEERAQTGLNDVEQVERTKECELPALTCTAEEQQAQNASVTGLLATTCNLDLDTVPFPNFLYLVQLCNGTTMYVFGVNQLNLLDGPYNVLDQIVVNSPDQFFDVVITEQEELFAMDFRYELNGNIDYVEWKVTDNQVKYYDYTYDPLNRITDAGYGVKRKVGTIPPGSYVILTDPTDDYRAFGFGYDAVGNIQSLKRYGMIPAGRCFERRLIDDLTYTYCGAQLHLVEDNAPTGDRDYGFRPGSISSGGRPGEDKCPPPLSYRYDANGNLTEDTHKALTFQYNYLNLPELISETGGSGQIELVYDASGRKLIKRGPDGDREYILGIEYLDGKLESIAAPDGRLVAEYDATTGTILQGYRAEYWRKDHLGNTRLAFSDLDNDGVITFRAGQPLEIMQESHYYPFGMNQVGDWYATVDPENKYTYNAKELNEELDLNWLDYGARWYDPAIGRWNAVDPLAKLAPSWTPYRYGFNNPVSYLDPNGFYEGEAGTFSPEDKEFSDVLKYWGIIGNGDDDTQGEQEGSTQENGGNDPLKITTDAGHGDKVKGSCCVDPGAVSGDFYEKDFALTVEEQVARFLSRFGYSIIRTRTEDVTISGKRLTWRLKKAADSEILISIHLDAGGEAGMFVMYNGSNPNSRDLARAIAQNQNILPLEGRGYFTQGEKGRGNLALLTRFKGEASVIIELGGIGNLQTRRAINTQADLIGLQIAVGVANYLTNR